MSNLVFAPGEGNVAQARFTPSLLFFWLKTDMAVTNRRFVARSPNKILGVIPLGFRDFAMPLHNIAGAGAAVRFSFFRALFGVVFVIGGIAGTSKNAVLGILFLLWGLALLAKAFSASLVLQNNAGSATGLRVSVFEKGKLEHFRNEVSSRLFIDHEGLRHNEVMGAHQLSVLLQQQQLQAMQGQIPGQQSMPPLGPRQVEGQYWPPAQHQPWHQPQSQHVPQAQPWLARAWQAQTWQPPQTPPQGQPWQSPPD